MELNFDEFETAGISIDPYVSGILGLNTLSFLDQFEYESIANDPLSKLILTDLSSISMCYNYIP